jgi:hypothetical protein
VANAVTEQAHEHYLFDRKDHQGGRGRPPEEGVGNHRGDSPVDENRAQPRTDPADAAGAGLGPAEALAGP